MLFPVKSVKQLSKYGRVYNVAAVTDVRAAVPQDLNPLLSLTRNRNQARNACLLNTAGFARMTRR